MSRLPALFIGHGNPMNTLASNRYTNAWGEIGKNLPKPRALLVVSAHWYIGATAVTAMVRPRTIHDFYGFPPELFAFRYPAPGAPDVAAEIAETVEPIWIGLDQDQWGLDHGAWSVLAHMYPQADIPVIQLSVNSMKSLSYHLELGAKLAPLRDRGILIVASGNIVHNLHRIDWASVDGGYDWAHRFDDAVMHQMALDPANILAATSHKDYDLAVPTPDHFIPLLYLAGLATAGEAAQALIRGHSLGSISMTAFGVGTHLSCYGDGIGATPLPAGVPPDNTNT